MKPVVLKRRSLVEDLASRGVRMTQQRRAVFETIQSAEGHLDAASLLEQSQQRDARIDRATIYRTINLLKRLRLIDELDLMHLNGEKHFYEVKTNVDHVHLACFQCGAIEEFTSSIFERLKGEIARENGFHIRVIRLEVGGRCRKCCEQTAGPAQCNENDCCKDGDCRHKGK
jgi:Fur family transcriptional regulator, ferric uptake regulator